MVGVLTRMILVADSRLATLDADAEETRGEGSSTASRRIEAEALELRRELEHPHAMRRRLAHRFESSRTVIPAPMREVPASE